MCIRDRESVQSILIASEHLRSEIVANYGLRSWQQSRFEDARSLSGLIERFPVLAAPIQQLEQSLYGGGEASAWQGDALLSAVLEVDAKASKRAAPTGPLVAQLNPQS